MVGKNNRPEYKIIKNEDEGWLHITLKTGGCTGTAVEIPDDKDLMRRIIAILQEQIDA